MRKRGSIIYWEMDGLESTVEKLIEMGFDKYAPSNKYKTAMIKALKVVTKGDDRMYKRFNDERDGVCFGIFYETTTKTDISIDKEFVIRVDKISGGIDLLTEGTKPALVESILREYDIGRASINSAQFTDTIKKFLKAEGFAISMRSKGGLYFVDEKFKDKVQHLKQVFSEFEGAKLYTIPLHEEDEDGLKALEDATSRDVIRDVERLVATIDGDSDMTRRKLDTKKTEAEKIIRRVRVHAHNLRSQSSKLLADAEGVAKALMQVTSRVESDILEPGDFMSALRSL